MHNLQFPNFTFVTEPQKVFLEKKPTHYHDVWLHDETQTHHNSQRETRGQNKKWKASLQKNDGRTWAASLTWLTSVEAAAASQGRLVMQMRPPPTQATELASLTSTRTLFLQQSARRTVLLTLLLTAVCRFEWPAPVSELENNWIWVHFSPSGFSLFDVGIRERLNGGSATWEHWNKTPKHVRVSAMCLCQQSGVCLCMCGKSLAAQISSTSIW